MMPFIIWIAIQKYTLKLLRDLDDWGVKSSGGFFLHFCLFKKIPFKYMNPFDGYHQPIDRFLSTTLSFLPVHAICALFEKLSSCHGESRTWETKSQGKWMILPVHVVHPEK